MSSLAWLIVFFFVLLFLCLLVYVLVVRAFYWGDKKNRLNGKQKLPKSGRIVNDGFGRCDVAGK